MSEKEEDIAHFHQDHSSHPSPISDTLCCPCLQ